MAAPKYRFHVFVALWLLSLFLLWQFMKPQQDGHVVLASLDLSKNYRPRAGLQPAFPQCVLASTHSRCFLGQQICNPGWEGPGCDRQQTSTLANQVQCEHFPDGLRSTNNHKDVLCYYQQELGIVTITQKLWDAAQEGEHREWVSTSGGTTDDRSVEMVEGFGGYKALPRDLGDVLEVGCGPYTQVKSILQTTGATVEHITLVEPGLFRYICHVAGCSYRDGTLGGLPTSLVSSPAEDMRYQASFDTVIMMNVLEHTLDSLAILERLVKALKPGGIMIFHDRYYDLYWRHINLRDDDFEIGGMHPIRMKKRAFELFFSFFEEPLFYSEEPPAAMKQRNLEREMRGNKMFEEPMWFIARKKANIDPCCP